MLQFSWALIHIIIVITAAFMAGRLLIGCYWRFEQKILQVAAETTIGLLCLSHLIFALSSFRLISQNIFLLLFGILALFAIGAGFFLKHSFRYTEKNISVFKPENYLPILFLALLYLGWVIACANLPPFDRDELIYHLEVPRQFLAQGGLVGFKDNIYGYFPQLGEMLFLFGLGTSGELAARLYHIICGVLLAGGLYGYSRAYLTVKNSLLAVFLFLSVPLVIVIMPVAYVDLIFSLYAFLAIICLLRYFKMNKLRWLVLCGIFIGACMATKYTGIQILVLLIAILLLEHISRQRRHWPVGAIVLAVTALTIFSPYLWRNWSLTGWPLFPFNIGNFPLNPAINWDAKRADLYLTWLGTFGAPFGQQTIGHILFAPVLVFLKGRFNEPQFYEGVIGPVFILVPFLLLFSRNKKPAEINWLVIFAALFCYYWALTTKQSRFLIPLLPVLSFLLIYGLANTGKKFLYILVAIFIIFNIFIGVRETLSRNPFSFWFGRETRDNFLMRQFPAFAIYQETNRHLSSQDTVYLINMKNYLYYLNCRVRADFVFERYSLDQSLENLSTLEQLADFFKKKNITHLLIDEAFVMSPKWGVEENKLNILRNFFTQQAKAIARDRNFTLYKLSR